MHDLEIRSTEEAMDNIEIRELTVNDFNSAFSLWSRTDGVGICGSDNAVDFRRFIERNSGMSFAAIYGNEIVGTILCGHDGRRGYIYHLAVDKAVRRRGIGGILVDRALASLESTGLEKCTLFVFADNEIGSGFWMGRGWRRRDDLVVYQKLLK
jgi:ribosomal protein S18 acetylase RimI-like enzyme